MYIVNADMDASQETGVQQNVESMGMGVGMGVGTSVSLTRRTRAVPTTKHPTSDSTAARYDPVMRLTVSTSRGPSHDVPLSAI